MINIALSNKASLVSHSLIRKLSDAGIRLSPAEIKVAELVRLGKSSKLIADHLNLSRETINSHRKNIRKKLHITSLKRHPRVVSLRVVTGPHSHHFFTIADSSFLL